MKNCNRPELVISGMGITSAIGQGTAAFASALMEGRHAFRVMQRPGRQKGTQFIGAEIPALSVPERLSARLLRTASFSGQAAMVTLHEAWEDARLDAVEPDRIGLVIGGSNLQQRELVRTWEAYAERIHYIRPMHGVSFMDSDLCGLCTEQFGIRGFAYTLGSASASGQAAILRAIQEVETGEADVCIAMGGLMDLSYLECQSFRSLGAMGTDRFAGDPAQACRPFDRQRDGFIYGEACGAVVIERSVSAARRGAKAYALITGWALSADGNRNPNPSYEGEMQVIKRALRRARLSAPDVDYVNPHGTGSIIGDETEARAIFDSGLTRVCINATKAITGHGLSAAGTVEVIATLIQMRESRLHPTRNLQHPLEQRFNWAPDRSVPHKIEHALCLSMGFGGVNTALCLQKGEPGRKGANA